MKKIHYQINCYAVNVGIVFMNFSHEFYTSHHLYQVFILDKFQGPYNDELLLLVIAYSYMRISMKSFCTIIVITDYNFVSAVNRPCQKRCLEKQS